jgi:hypothetical protein
MMKEVMGAFHRGSARRYLGVKKKTWKRRDNGTAGYIGEAR